MIQNPYESGAQKSIPAVLVYLKRRNSKGQCEILMMNRDGRKAGDYHKGKWNGLGGKFEKNESPEECAVREIKEECGLELDLKDLRSLGVIHFPNFKAHKNEDWMVFLFTAFIKDSSAVATESAEGGLAWILEEEVMSLPLWAGDRHFFPLILKEEPFMATIWYEGDKVVKHSVTAMKSV